MTLGVEFNRGLVGLSLFPRYVAVSKTEVCVLIVYKNY